VALALAVVGGGPVRWGERGAARILPVPVLAGLTLAYFAFVLYPTASAASLVQQAKVAEEALARDELREPKDRTIKSPVRHVATKMIAPLGQAARDAPDDDRVHSYLAVAYLRLWEQDPRDPLPGERAIAAAGQVRKLDPEAPESYRLLYLIRIRLARGLDHVATLLRKEARQSKEPRRQKTVLRQAADRAEARARIQRGLALEALEKAIERSPTEASLYYYLAEGLFALKEEKKGREAAAEALRLDELASTPWRRLTYPQRSKLRDWLKGNPDG
jgi:hypothetical protein